MKISDPNYPNISIASEASIEEHPDGFMWRIRLHIIGPDDVFARASEMYESRQKCTEDLLFKYPHALQSLINEAFE